MQTKPFSACAPQKQKRPPPPATSKNNKGLSLLALGFMRARRLCAREGGGIFLFA